MQNIPQTKNIIKAYGNTEDLPVRRNVIKNQILLAQKKAKQIIEEAEEYAAGVREFAEIESKNKLKEAFEQGTEEALLEFEQNLLQAKEIRDRILRETEKDVLKLSVRLAEKIVGQELETDKETIKNIVSTALQNARQKERITIRVNPSDLQTVQNNGEQFKSTAQSKFIDFVADPRVEKGGCLIESEVGTVDARLETQFRVLERALLAQADGEFIVETE